MATDWTLAAADICTDALEHLGVIGDGEAASGGDMQLALRALDAILKELPLVGYSWPKLSGETALTWTSGQTIALPADYYSYPVAWKLVNGSKVLLTQLTHAQWIALPTRSSVTGEPHSFYIGPDKVLNLFPTPTVNPVVTLQYQKLVDNAEQTAQPDMPQYWLNALGYGVAHELALKFGVPPAKAAAIEQRWMAKRATALESSIASEPISFEVRD